MIIMNKAEILQQIEIIFRDIFDEEEIILNETTTADDVDGWDSLSHFLVIDAIEKHFNIKFLSNEILLWKNIGEMSEAIYLKTR